MKEECEEEKREKSVRMEDEKVIEETDDYETEGKI